MTERTGGWGKRVSDEDVVAAYWRTGSVWKAGKDLGLAGQTVHERLHRLGVRLAHGKWSADEVGELRALLGAGLPVGQIANRLGRTFAGVACKMNDLNLRAAPRPKTTKVPRGAGYDKVSIGRHLAALERSALNVTPYCRANGLNVEAFVTAVEGHHPDRWFAYVKAHSDLPETECPYCGRWFHPNNGKQKHCSRRCSDAARVDAAYFGGQRRTAIGLAEGVCQLCGRKDVKGLSAHHVLGKENDPENAALIALCPGCHKIVTMLATRTLVDDAVFWETLIQLCWLRRHGAAVGDLAGKGIYVAVELQLEDLTEEELAAMLGGA